MLAKLLKANKEIFFLVDDVYYSNFFRRNRALILKSSQFRQKMNKSVSWKKSLGRYQYIQPLGKGSYGKVCLVRDPSDFKIPEKALKAISILVPKRLSLKTGKEKRRTHCGGIKRNQSRKRN